MLPPSDYSVDRTVSLWSLWEYWGNHHAMTVIWLVCISSVLSVLATAIAVLALRYADPADNRVTLKKLRADLDEVRNNYTDLVEVGLPRLQGQAEALLERAELRFDEAERKRKSVAARERHAAGNDSPGNGAGFDPTDERIPRADRKAAIEALFRR